MKPDLLQGLSRALRKEKKLQVTCVSPVWCVGAGALELHVSQNARVSKLPLLQREHR